MFVTLLAGMMLTGGCATRAELDEARAAARRANDALAAAQNALEQLKDKNKELMAQLDERQRLLDAEMQKNGLLTAAYNKLKGEYDALNEKYLALLVHKEPVTTALPDEVNEALRKLAEENGWKFDEKRGVVRLSSDLTFEKGKDVVKPGPKAALEKFARIMNGATASPFYVYVAGHTDDIPIRKGTKTAEMHPNNWYLSVHRSISVQQVLSGAGLKDKRIGAMGYGENYPIAPNAAGNKGNAINRRVELWIVPVEKFLVLPMTEGGDETPAVEPTKKTGKTPAKPPVEETGTTTPEPPAHD
jgi:flagellar motor protein MotB